MSGERRIPEVFASPASSDAVAKDLNSGVEIQGGSQKDVLQESDGFIPITELSLSKLPEAIRSQANLERILDVAKHVVCVNNNQASAERPPDFRIGNTIKGTGFIFFITKELATATEDQKMEHIAVVSTNRHVLYNDEEVRKATIDIFYDHPMSEAIKLGKMKRTARGRGLGTLRSNQDEDFTLALFVFDDKTMAHIADPSFDEEKFPVLLHQMQTDAGGSSVPSESLVCVISHPLGQPKRVSFGQLLEEDVARRTLRHSAPTRVGSSGAPLLVFSPEPLAIPPNSVWYHIAYAPESETKIGGLQVNDSHLFQMKMKTDPSATIHHTPSNLAHFMQVTSLDPECAIQRALEGIANSDLLTRVASNTAYLSCFGSFLLRPEAYLAGSSRDAFQPCESVSAGALETALERGGEDVKNALKFLRITSPTLVPADLRENRDPRRFAQFISEQGPCYCGVILSALVSTRGSSDGEAGRLIHPHSAPSIVTRQPSWPFQVRDDSPALCVPDRCFLQVMLSQLTEGDNSVITYVCLLGPLMALLEANSVVRAHMDSGCSTPRSVDGDTPSESPELDEPRSQAALKFVLFFIDWGLKHTNMLAVPTWMQCNMFLNLFPVALTLSQPVSDTPEEEVIYKRTTRTEPAQRATLQLLEAFDDLKCLLRHASKHNVQGHRDAPSALGSEVCRCGRPLIAGLLEATSHLQTLQLELSKAAEEASADLKSKAASEEKNTQKDQSESGTVREQAEVASRQGGSLTATENEPQEKTGHTTDLAGLMDALGKLQQTMQSLSTASEESDGSRGDDRPLNVTSETGERHVARPLGDAARADGADQQKAKPPAGATADLLGAFNQLQTLLQQLPVAPATETTAAGGDGLTSEAGGSQRDEDKASSRGVSSEASTGDCSQDRGEHGTAVKEGESRGNEDDVGPPSSTQRNPSSCSNVPPQQDTSVSTGVLDHEGIGHLEDHASAQPQAPEGDAAGTSCQRTETNETEKNDESEDVKDERSIKDLGGLIRTLSDAVTAKFATMNTTMMAAVLRPAPKTVMTLRTTRREAELSEELAERYRAALLASTVPFRNMLAAIEVLHYDSRTFLNRCHKFLGCHCSGHSEILVPKTQDAVASSPRGHGESSGSPEQSGPAVDADANSSGGIGSVAHNSSASLNVRSPEDPGRDSLAASDEASARQDPPSGTLEDPLSEETKASTGTGSAPDATEDRSVKEQGSDRRRQALKKALLRSLQVNADSVARKTLLHEDCLQALSEMLDFAESEGMSERDVARSLHRSSLVLSWNCEDTIAPLQGLDLLALTMFERMRAHLLRELGSSEGSR